MTSDTGTFTLQRGDQTYGPYTVEEVAAYLASGNLTPSDSVFDHEGQSWRTVSSVVGGRAAGVGSLGTPVVVAAAGPSLGGSIGAAACAPASAAASTPVNGWAIAALVSGILSLTGGGIFLGIAAILLAGRAMKEPDRGGGMARAGLITGIIGASIGFLAIVGVFIGWVLIPILN